jgi:hypothetical protein
MEERASKPGQKTPTLTQNDEILKSNQRKGRGIRRNQKVSNQRLAVNQSSESEAMIWLTTAKKK